MQETSSPDRTTPSLRTLSAQTALCVALVLLVLGVFWWIPSRSTTSEGGANSTEAGSFPKGPASVFQSRAEAVVEHLFIVGSNHARVAFEQSLQREDVVRAALTEPARRAWVVVAADDAEAELIRDIVRNDNGWTGSPSREVLVTDLRNP